MNHIAQNSARVFSLDLVVIRIADVTYITELRSSLCEEAWFDL